MTMIDKKGRLFGKINIIDLAILLIVLAAVGLVYIYYLQGTGSSAAVNRKIEYSIELKEKPGDYAAAVKLGDAIWDSVEGSYLGKVADKQVVPATKINENLEKGEYVKAKIPGRYDVVLKLEANGTVTDQSVLAEGVEIRVGKKVNVKGKGYASEGYIVGIHLNDEL